MLLRYINIFNPSHNSTVAWVFFIFFLNFFVFYITTNSILRGLGCYFAFLFLYYIHFKTNTKHFLLFIYLGFIVAFTEALYIYFLKHTKSVWKYDKPDFFFIPYFLPPLWSLVSITIVILYSTNNKY